MGELGESTTLPKNKKYEKCLSTIQKVSQKVFYKRQLLLHEETDSGFCSLDPALI